MDRRKFLGFVVFPAGIAALLAFLFFVAKVDVFRTRSTEQSIAELSSASDTALRWKAAADLKRRGDKAAIPALRAALKDENPAVRWHSADALAALARREAAPDVAALLKDKDQDVRRVAAFLLGDIGDPGTREALREAARDPVEVVRWNAAVALARLGDGSAVPVLHEMLRAPAPRSVGGAVRTLVPGNEIAPPEPDRTVHANALLALALVGGPESIRPVETFIEADIEPDLNDTAKQVLTRLKTKTTKASE